MNAQRSNFDDVQNILQDLKKTAEGTILYGLIARGLRKFSDTRVEAAFLAFADKLLDRYLSNPLSDPGTRVRVRIIQQRLHPFLNETTAALQAAELGMAPPVALAALPDLEETPHTPNLDTLPEQLARQMADTLTRGRELDNLLHSSLATLKSGGDVNTLKQQLARGIEEMLDEHRAMEQQVATASQEIQHLAEDRRQLVQALDRARKNSLTDELTGLPNHAAFLRALEAETGRARRHEFSLVVAILNINNLDAINTRYGIATGDAVLHTYAHEILSHFRGYDMVARYGGGEFAVILPNTQKAGAVRALEKVHKKAAGLSVHVEGRNIPMPGFSSALTVYTQGETPESLLRRANEALARTRQSGRAQTVVATSSA